MYKNILALCFFLFVLAHGQTIVANETLFGNWSGRTVGTSHEILPAAPMQQLFVCATGLVAGAAAISLTPMAMPLIPVAFSIKALVGLGSTLLGSGVILRRAIMLNNAFASYKQNTIGASKTEEPKLRSLMQNAFLSSFILPASLGALAVIIRYRGFPL